MCVSPPWSHLLLCTSPVSPVGNAVSLASLVSLPPWPILSERKIPPASPEVLCLLRLTESNSDTRREGLQLCLQLPVSFKENPSTFNKNHSVMFGKGVCHVILGSLGSVAQFSFKQMRTKGENYVFAKCSGAHRLGQVITLSWLEDFHF